MVRRTTREISNGDIHARLGFGPPQPRPPRIPNPNNVARELGRLVLDNSWKESIGAHHWEYHSIAIAIGIDIAIIDIAIAVTGEGIVVEVGPASRNTPAFITTCTMAAAAAAVND